jgi:hypothetical protein
MLVESEKARWVIGEPKKTMGALRTFFGVFVLPVVGAVGVLLLCTLLSWVLSANDATLFLFLAAVVLAGCWMEFYIAKNMVRGKKKMGMQSFAWLHGGASWREKKKGEGDEEDAERDDEHGDNAVVVEMTENPMSTKEMIENPITTKVLT